MIESLKEKGRETQGTDWAATFARLDTQRIGREPAWLAQRRRAAMDRFAELGYPTSKLEEWRYTSVGPLARIHFTTELEPQEGVTPDGLLLAGAAAIRLVFIDGHFAPHLSTGELPAGLRAGSITRVLESEPARLEPYLGSLETHGAQPFLSLNTALFSDGAYVHVDRGVTIERPVHVYHAVSSAHDAPAIQARNLVVLEENSAATVIESYGPVDAASAVSSFTNAVTEAIVGPGAHLDHIKLQEESARASHLATSKVRIDRDGELRSHFLSLGAALARNMFEVAFSAEGGFCSLQGLYVINEAQHADCQTFVDHAVPHCTSEQNYRGILGGASRGVFQGGVLVRPDAQKTNATQSNKNLLLSDRAKADTKPQLEIHADDVKCAHGATIGELDPDAIFFLRSRGIGEEAARGMLMRGFVDEIAQTVSVGAVAAHLNRALASKLGDDGAGVNQKR